MLVTMLKIGEIKPYANNPRRNAKAIDVVANSLQQFGFQQPIVVDSDKVIIVGHTRFLAAKKLELKEVPVLIADGLTAEQAKQYRIMDNRSNENAKWDDDLLLQELTSLLKDNDIQSLSHETGFTESELAKMFKGDLEKDLSQYLNPLQPKSRPGDLWILGDHKLLNGSSVDAEDVKKLMGEAKIDLVWEDPPYGVSYQTPAGINRSDAENKLRNHKIANDALTPEKLDLFLMDHVKALTPFVKPNASIYWCHDIRFNEQFKKILIANKWHISDTLIWKKNVHSVFTVDYAKIYEPILYGWKEGGQHNWYAKDMQRNVIELDKLEDMTKEELINLIQSFPTNYQPISKESRKIASLHPTVKPTKLIMYHLINSTKVNQLVYDGFSGSGSTLIAAEKTGRIAHCIELEPKFIDVTIARWQDETGLQAYRESDNVKWDDIVVEVNNDAAMEAFFNLPDTAEIENE